MKKSSIYVFIFALIELNHVIETQQFKCINPNNNSGYCIDIRECPTLREVLLTQSKNNNIQEFLLASECKNGFGKPPYVCCTEDRGFTSSSREITTSTTIRNMIPTQFMRPNSKNNNLPEPPRCGTQTLSNKIYSGNATALDEFPWMVLIEYRNNSGDRSLSCGGSLINQRYVITAAHCVAGDILRRGDRPVAVRLGEYDISKDIDCVDGDCADPIVLVPIEDIIVHEKFNPYTPQGGNDIALIRLNQDVKYSDFIKPICLPSAVNLERSEVDESVTVAGWGRTLLLRQSQIKQKLNIPIFEQNKCVQQYSRKRIIITDDQLCAGGKFKEDSCDGDSGGPLMRLKNDFWALEGIVSFGNGCGLEGWPGIYTRVSKYENWIRDNLKS